jgi:hypothetical protein
MVYITEITEILYQIKHINLIQTVSRCIRILKLIMFRFIRLDVKVNISIKIKKYGF